MFVHETGQLNPRFIINFPTKRHWRGKSHIRDIDSGLTALVAEVRKLGLGIAPFLWFLLVLRG